MYKVGFEVLTTVSMKMAVFLYKVYILYISLHTVATT
jgi:hypothetical protein